jgi:alkylation response protein AidB-like acyl-CoA dehydrogenase
MLSFSLGPAADRVRTELRQWLESNPPPLLNYADSSVRVMTSLGRQWQRTLSEGRWIGVHWPSECGGRGLSLVEEALVQEELMRAHAPQLLGLFGLSMVGPVLIEHGTAEQKEKYLSRILSGEDIWCQGFSEPDAGSDLANVRTEAKESVDSITNIRSFRVTGSKVWTSFAHVADWCFLLARTSRGAKKHEGLTYLLVPMRAPGVTVRPLRQMSGESEFNEVFFDDVIVPFENVVGIPGNGWKIAVSTLMYERVVLTLSRHLQSERVLSLLMTQYRQGTLSPLHKEQLAKEVSEFIALRALACDHLSRYSLGKSPGPEGSIDKLLWSETFQSLCRLALEVKGNDAALTDEDPDLLRYLYSRGRTIAAGTSEIQRTIIAERLCGLPRLAVVP